jgi:hypothetical protein
MLQAVTSAAIWFALVWLPVIVVFLGLVILARLVFRRAGLAGPVETTRSPGT